MAKYEFETLFFLNFMMLDMSFEIGYEKVYSLKYA